MLNNNHIHESAKIPVGIQMGFNVIISAEVTIGPGTIIRSNVIIHEGSSIGANVRIDDNTVIGKLPVRAANSVMKPTGELPACIIGDNCIIGANVIIYRGCSIGQKVLIADLATIRENVKIGPCIDAMMLGCDGLLLQTAPSSTELNFRSLQIYNLFAF